RCATGDHTIGSKVAGCKNNGCERDVLDRIAVEVNTRSGREGSSGERIVRRLEQSAKADIARYLLGERYVRIAKGDQECSKHTGGTCPTGFGSETGSILAKYCAERGTQR